MISGTRILAIAERANVPGIRAWEHEQFRAEWKARWESPKRIRYILGLNSMIAGCRTRVRMETMLGLPSDTKVVNLLWPDYVSGTWDHAAACDAAMDVMKYIAGQDRERIVQRFDRLIFFGRRVMTAFNVPISTDWGTRLNITDDGWRQDNEGTVLILPHPSGRSTVLNDLATRERLRTAVKNFLW